MSSQWISKQRHSEKREAETRRFQKGNGNEICTADDLVKGTNRKERK